MGRTGISICQESLRLSYHAPWLKSSDLSNALCGRRDSPPLLPVDEAYRVASARTVAADRRSYPARVKWTASGW